MRKRVFVIMLLPLIILLWIIGWSLYWTGTKTQPKTAKQTTTSRDNGIEITIAPPEEITAQTA
jgi:flagellar basal body-associated protein FliL